jgi:hypothetical protein
VVCLLNEGENISTLTATKAVVVADTGANVKARAALIVEGTQSLERTNARVLERNMIPDDICDIQSGLELLNV